MKKIIILTISILLIFPFTSCNDFFDVNDDPNNPTQSTPALTLPVGISAAAYVIGGWYQIAGGIWSQHWTQATGAGQYRDFDNWQITTETLGGRQFSSLYNESLNDLNYVIETAEAQENWSYYLMGQVMSAYVYQMLADLYDQIPYEEALKGDEGLLNPKWDEGQNVYDGLVNRLKDALSKDFTLASVVEPGDEDLVFQGDLEQWRRFANTLLLKLYIRQSEARPEVARQGIQELYARNAQFLETSANMGIYGTTQNTRNPFYETEIDRFSYVNIVASKSIIDFLQDAASPSPIVDPRINTFFDTPGNGGGHVGQLQGDNRNTADYPDGEDDVSQPDIAPNEPVVFLSASESYFLQAEAAVRFPSETGLDTSDAKDLYEQGVKASFANEGLIPADADLLLANRYAFPEAGSMDEQIQAIIVQKWVAMTNSQGMESWLEHNRTGYPTKGEYVEADDEIVNGVWTTPVENVTGGIAPKRLMFPFNEVSRNPSTPDIVEFSVPVWWDVD